MNPASATNASTSATTSASAPTLQADESQAVSESEFLAQQAAAAQKAIAHAFGELKSDLAQGVDPRLWMKSHPWITLASAAVAGFAAAATVVPSKEEQKLKKLQAIHNALHGSENGGKTHNGNGSEKANWPGGLVSSIVHELLSIVKPALITLLTAKIATPPAPSDAEKK